MKAAPVSAFGAAAALNVAITKAIADYTEASAAPPPTQDPWALSSTEPGAIVTTAGELIFRPEGDRREAAALAVKLVNLYFAGAGMGPEYTGLSPFETASAQVLAGLMAENKRLEKLLYEDADFLELLTAARLVVESSGSDGDHRARLEQATLAWPRPRVRAVGEAFAAEHAQPERCPHNSGLTWDGGAYFCDVCRAKVGLLDVAN